MRNALQMLLSNPHVRIRRKHGSSWITLRPFDVQPEPPNLTALKAEITATWPLTSLLDVVKEADLRLGFTDALKSPTAYETLDRAISSLDCCSVSMVSAPISLDVNLLSDSYEPQRT